MKNRLVGREALAVVFVATLCSGPAGAQESPPPEAAAPEAQVAPAAEESTPAAAQPAAPAPEKAAEAPAQQAPAKPSKTAEQQGPTAPSAAVAPTGDRPEEILITGSRIRSSAIDKPAPVLTVTSEDIERSGVVNVGDFLQRLPLSGGGLNSRFNQSGNAGFPPDGSGVGAGSAQADLRYLGPKRVLVLVDGVRWVNGAAASGVPAATDLNTIPMSIVDHIEVLQDGASPIYGSDAIAGVINIITRKDFSGMSANAEVGGYSAGDGATQDYDLSFGNKSDKVMMMLNLSFMDQGRVSAADRAISEWPTAGIEGCTDRCSSGTPQGRIVGYDPNTHQDIDLALKPGVSGMPVYDPANPDSGSYRAFGLADRFNFQPYNLMLTPVRRYGAFSAIDYKASENVSVFAKALFNTRRSINQAAPTPLFVGPLGGNGNRLDTISIDATQKYNPFGFTFDANDPDHPYMVTRRPVEAGPRIFEQNVETLYAATGMHGQASLGRASPFYWDVTGIYSRNRADQVMSGNFNSARLQKALGPAAECEADPECVPFNIFGGMGGDGSGTITKDMLDYVTFKQHDLSQQELWDLTANVTGSLFDLPAGALSVAAGVEYRDQRGFFQPDAIVVAGDSSDVPSSPTSGSFNVAEGYAELVLPILADKPLADLLDVSAAARYSKYSTFGGETTYKVGLRYRPLPDVMLRGLFVQGFRAPAIGELYGSAARFDQVLQDPCSDYTGVLTGAGQSAEIQANCAAMGIPATYEQLNPQVSVTTGGNRDLKPETSNTFSAGFVFTPSFLARTSYSDLVTLEVTYYHIELDDAIQAINAQVQLDLCARTMDPVLCSGITRLSTGHIAAFGNALTNIGGLTTSGLDIALTYVTPLTPIGRFRLTSLTNYMLGYDEKIPSSTGFDTVARVGSEVGDPPQAFPKVKSTLIADYLGGSWRASWVVRYINSVTESCRDLSGTGLCSDPNATDDSLSTNKLGTTVYNDVQVGYTPSLLDDRFSVTVGVNNLFNQDPPNCYSCALNGFDPTTYDIPGVYGYVRAGYRL